MPQEGVRLQKVLAQAGVASRRAAEQLIIAGRVSVNGQIVTELGTRVKPGQDVLEVDGERLPLAAEKPVYIMLNKPRGILSTVEDARGRRTVADLVNLPERLFPIGRLDLNSEGLMLLTNDGEIAHQLTHPRYGHEKEYEVLVEGFPLDPVLVKWRRGGVLVDGTPSAPCRVERLRVEPGACQGEDGTWLRVTMREGRKRQIRRLAAALGHPAYRIIRVRIGPVKLGSLKVGTWRHLTSTEVDALRAALSGTSRKPDAVPRGSSSAQPRRETTTRPLRQETSNNRPVRTNTDRRHNISSKSTRRRKSGARKR